MADVQVFGLNAGAHHLVSVVLHLLSALLLFAVFRRMTGARWPPALVACLFALHPLHVESVAWVAERKDVLSGLFWMLTLLAYARYVGRPGRGRYALVLAAFGLGLMAKSMLVTLPLVLLLLDWWPLGRWSRHGRSSRPGDAWCRSSARNCRCWRCRRRCRPSPSSCSGRRAPWPRSTRCLRRAPGQRRHVLRRLPSRHGLAGPPGHLLSAPADRPVGRARRGGPGRRGLRSRSSARPAVGPISPWAGSGTSARWCPSSG